MYNALLHRYVAYFNVKDRKLLQVQNIFIIDSTIVRISKVLNGGVMTKQQLYLLSFIILLTATTTSAQVTFTNVTEAVGLGGHLPAESARTATWGDYDNDGDVDVVLMNHGINLYRNEESRGFLNVTQKAGITDISFSTGAATFVDFDNDGDLDLFVASDLGDFLYRNNGDGTFLNVTQAAGIEPKDLSIYPRFGAVFFDYDVDGLLDIYIANHELPNVLYHNEGNGHFKEMAAQIGLDKPELSMGIILGDYDDDSDLDLFITVDGWLVDDKNYRRSGNSVLYRNDGDGVFLDVAQQAGVQRK